MYNKYNQTVASIHAGFLTWYKLEGKSLFFVYIGVLVRLFTDSDYPFGIFKLFFQDLKPPKCKWKVLQQ
jgi:hypothetical protein